MQVLKCLSLLLYVVYVKKILKLFSIFHLNIYCIPSIVVSLIIDKSFQTSIVLRVLIICAAELETYMVSVQRVEEYCKIPSEVNSASLERISKICYCVIV